MKVTIIQSELAWEDRDANLNNFETLIGSIGEQTDLIVLPEMFSTGFSMFPHKIAEEDGGAALQWMKSQAAKTRAVVAGSLAIKENGQYYNRFYWVLPSGEPVKYDKRHLFRIAGEEKQYGGGNERVIIPYRGCNFMPIVCYDLRFPVWCRNRFVKESPFSCASEYDVIICVANWPANRSHAWKSLLAARAIENQAFVIGVNRIGKDGHGYDHSGDSVVLDHKGMPLTKPVPDSRSVQTVELDREAQEEFRRLFPVGLDADDFQLKI
jgi:omega-amidase